MQLTLNIQLIAALAANLVLSAAAGSMARQWALTHVSLWLVGAVVTNAVGFLPLAWVIRISGLGLGTSLALLASIVVNTLIGVFFFHEILSVMQISGIVLGIASLVLMMFG